jgi:hypothetical protein
MVGLLLKERMVRIDSNEKQPSLMLFRWIGDQKRRVDNLEEILNRGRDERIKVFYEGTSALG